MLANLALKPVTTKAVKAPAIITARKRGRPAIPESEQRMIFALRSKFRFTIKQIVIATERSQMTVYKYCYSVPHPNRRGMIIADARTGKRIPVVEA